MNSKLRRIAAVCLTLALALCACAASAGEFLVSDEGPADSASLWERLFGAQEPAGETDVAKDARYREALAQLLDGSVVDAMNGFSQLGKYRESIRLTDYAAARLSYLRGDLRAAKAGFEALGDFGDAAFQAELCGAMALHRVYQKGQFGYADLEGRAVIAPAYDWAERVFRDESRAAGRGADALRAVAVVFAGETSVRDGDVAPGAGKYGLIARDGSLVAPLAYDEVLWTKDGLAALRAGGEVAIVDLLTGGTVGEGFDQALEYREGYVPVCSDGKWGFMDAAGALIGGALLWDDAQPFSEGLAAVCQGGLYGYIDATGALRVPLEYQDAQPFGEGLAGVRWSKRWGFINADNERVIKNTYAYAGAFDEGLCPVKKSGKYGLIDKQGTAVTKFRYDEITPFEKVYHRAWIRQNKLWGLVNLDGTIVLKPTWNTYTPFAANGMSRVSYKNRYGYIDAMGVSLIQNVYEQAAPFAAGRGGVIGASGRVEYLDRFSHGFTVDGDVPTEALCGFIEGRRLGETTVARDAETGETETVATIAFRLFNTDGTPVTGWSD